MKRTMKITQTGFVIRGTALINMWGGGQGSIDMDETFIPYKELTPKRILSCVNDGQFGCESIESADIDIGIKYDNGNTEYDRTLFVDHKIHTQYFGKRGI